MARRQFKWQNGRHMWRQKQADGKATSICDGLKETGLLTCYAGVYTCNDRLLF